MALVGSFLLRWSLRVLAVVLMVVGALLVGRGAALILQAPFIAVASPLVLRAAGIEIALGAGLGWLGWMLAGRVGRSGGG